MSSARAWILLTFFIWQGSAQAELVKRRSINQPRPEVIRSGESHEVQILNEGIGALEKRLQMIESARETIELETFFLTARHQGWSHRSTRIILDALIKKAKDPVHPVKVRLLLDHFPTRSGQVINPFYLTPLIEAGIEVRYYNAVWTINIPAIFHRNHRKLLIVDGREFISGGRNIADEYFDLNPKFNFLDRDIWVKGPIAEQVKQTFERFWESSTTSVAFAAPEPTLEKFKQSPSAKIRVNAREEWAKSYYIYKLRMNEVREYFEVPLQAEWLVKIRAMGKRSLARARVNFVGEVYFISDSPGRGSFARRTGPFIDDLLSEVTTSLDIENFCYVVEGVQADSMKKLLDRSVRVRVETNGFRSSELRWLGILSYLREKKAVKMGAEIYRYSGVAPSKIQELDPSVISAKWIIHSKSMVWDGENSFVSTFNFDPRSRHLNAECAVLVPDSREVADDILGSMGDRILDSNILKPSGKVTRAGVPVEDDEPSFIEWMFTAPIAEVIKDQY